MTDPDKPDYLGRATDEIKGIAKEGFSHPGTKPLMTGAVVGAVAGALLPIVSLPLGLIAGAGFMLWRRIKR